jgi:uncharacterized protein YjdB
MLKQITRVVAALAITAAATVTTAGQAVARSEPTGTFCYQAHVQNIGWQDWRCDGEWAGTTGRALAVEAVRFHVQPGSSIRFCARAHRANYGWDDRQVCVNGSHTTDQIGIDGVNVAMEAIMFAGSPTLNADAHISNDGWQGGAAYVGASEYNTLPNYMIGTTGRGLPIEAFWFQVA